MFFQLIFAVFLMFSTLNGSYRTLASREGRGWAGGVVGERKEEKGRGREWKQRDGEEGRGGKGKG